jgi:hypothetical protein
VLGFVVSYLLIEATLRARESPQLGLLLFYAELAAPVVGAIAGYYWPWRKPRVEAR